MGDGEGETLVGEAGRILVLFASGSSFLLGETEADWALGYFIVLSVLLQPDIFIFFKHIVLDILLLPPHF